MTIIMSVGEGYFGESPTLALKLLFSKSKLPSFEFSAQMNRMMSLKFLLL